ncbi:MATE family efflux transporter [Cellulomonas citrea]|uniref:MATE family efflux transporter n=1 Tax=Cellulomonas citrea TaxID=1909423 RepID=UPI00135840C2|nr:MATE family efflux transporter [Cellulomonas citrea]
MTTSLTSGPPARLIAAFALPLLVGSVVQQLYSLVDAAVVGRFIGVDALAAVGSTGGLAFLLIGFTLGATSGFAIPVAHAFGAADLPALRRAVVAGTVACVGIAVVLTAVSVPLSRPVLAALNTPAELLDDATTFAAVQFGGIGAMLAFTYLCGVIRALGDSRTPLLLLVGSCVLNAGLVVLLVGPLHSGVAGAALATIIAQLLATAIGLVVVVRTMPELRLPRADRTVSRPALRETLRIGLPMGFQMSIVAIGAIALQYAINGLGAQAVAAFTAAMRVDQLAIAPLAALGVATATFVAQNRGALAWARIRKGTAQTSAMAVGTAIVVGAVTIVAGPTLVEAFVGPGNEPVVELARTYFWVNGPLYSAVGVLFVIRNALQGLGLAGWPTVAGVFELVARTAAALLLVGPLGFLGVSMAAPLAWFGALAPLLVAWYSRRRRLIADEQVAQLEAAHRTPVAA